MEFLLAKLVAQLASPLCASLALGGAALLALARGRRAACAALLSLSLALLWAASTQAVALPLARSLERRFPPRPVADAPAAGAIVVLGGSLRPPAPEEAWSDLDEGADRLVHAARLFRAGKAPWLVVSGGSPWQRQGRSPAWEMGELLAEWGVPRSALLLEERSRNTHENAAETRALLAERGIDDVLLVTSALHMPRALAAFRSEGLRATPAATDYQALHEPSHAALVWLPSAGNLSLTQQVIKERLGAFVYRRRGWIRDAAPPAARGPAK
jgi:uncharacterized SAM-binding protein YcdF (DUF218 family)